MQLVLNELSFIFPTDCIEMGKKLFENFLTTYINARKQNLSDQVILDKNYKYFEIAPEYNILKWYNDNDIDKKLKDAFRSLINKSYVYDSKDFEEAAFDINQSEFKLSHNRSAIGCLIAYETDNCVISFSAADCWNNSQIDGNYSTLDNEETIESPIQVSVPNISNMDNLNSFLLNYSSKLQTDFLSKFKSGSSILAQREKDFPNLIFCNNAIEQLNNEVDPIRSRQIAKHLLELQTYFANCNTKFDKSAIKHATPESKATMQKYKAEHTFQLPDDSYRQFEWHVRFTSGHAGRIFFLPDAPNHQCYIGHIGKKLPTVSTPTS